MMSLSRVVSSSFPKASKRHSNVRRGPEPPNPLEWSPWNRGPVTVSRDIGACASCKSRFSRPGLHLHHGWPTLGHLYTYNPALSVTRRGTQQHPAHHTVCHMTAKRRASTNHIIGRESCTVYGFKSYGGEEGGAGWLARRSPGWNRERSLYFQAYYENMRESHPILLPTLAQYNLNIRVPRPKGNLTHYKDQALPEPHIHLLAKWDTIFSRHPHRPPHRRCWIAIPSALRFPKRATPSYLPWNPLGSWPKQPGGMEPSRPSGESNQSPRPLRGGSLALGH